MDVTLTDRPSCELGSPGSPLPPIGGPPRRSWSPRRRRVAAFVAAVLAVAVAVGGVCWHQTVTADPGLEFDGAASNVFRTVGDKSGVVDLHNAVGDEAQVAFTPGGRFVAFAGLRNGGSRDVRVEAVAPRGFYYWGLDRAVVSADPDDYFPEGDRRLGPLTLGAGETRRVRLEFRLADCDPAGLQDGFSSIDSLPVTYRVLGSVRTVDVPLWKAAISVTTIGRCDRPILNHD